MPKLKYNYVPDFREEPEAFLECIADMLERMGGLGPDSSGDLDKSDNLSDDLAHLSDDETVTGNWTIPGYFRLSGVSGGQTAIGGTDAGDDLLFQSTSHATTGSIAFTSLTNGLIWDEENKRLSLGGDENELTIGGVTKGAAFFTHNQGGGNAYDIIFERHSNSSPAVLTGARTRGSESSEKAVEDGDDLFEIKGVGYDGTDFEYAAEIHFEVDGTPGDGDMPGMIRFLTTPSGSGTPIERMRINSAGHAVFDKASDKGIKVDLTTPTYGFADLLGDQFSKNTGATKPTLVAYNGVINAWQFAAGDEAFMSFHIPHDYVKGSDIFLHVHWSHIGTLVTGGTLTFKATSIYSKGHNQTAFTGTPAVGTFTGTASTTQYQHIISETQYSASSPSGLQIDTDLIEPDGVIEITLEMDVNNMTVSGGGVPDPFIHYVDIHYQTTGIIGTKDKEPDFYA